MSGRNSGSNSNNFRIRSDFPLKEISELSKSFLKSVKIIPGTAKLHFKQEQKNDRV